MYKKWKERKVARERFIKKTSGNYWRGNKKRKEKELKRMKKKIEI